MLTLNPPFLDYEQVDRRNPYWILVPAHGSHAKSDLVGKIPQKRFRGHAGRPIRLKEPIARKIVTFDFSVLKFCDVPHSPLP